MVDTPPTPAPLVLVETGPDGGRCDAATGICTTVSTDRQGPLLRSEYTADEV
ncbi:hypothetical protein ACWD4T_25920 [Streptomyces umbrinus]